MQPDASNGVTPPPYQPMTPEPSQPVTMQDSVNGVSTPPAPHKKPPKIYSFNTRSINHTRKAMKISGVVAIMLLLLFIAFMVAVWSWLGSPKDMDDLYDGIKQVVH